MGFTGRLLLGMALLTLVILTPAFAQVPEIEGSADVYFTDNYFWRAADVHTIKIPVDLADRFC